MTAEEYFFHFNAQLEIVEGRHPTVEALSESTYVPNSIRLNMGRRAAASDSPPAEDEDDSEVKSVVLSGPNLGGKSSFSRQARSMFFCQEYPISEKRSARAG